MTILDKGDGYDILDDAGNVRGSYRDRQSAAIHHAMQVEHNDRMREALRGLGERMSREQIIEIVLNRLGDSWRMAAQDIADEVLNLVRLSD